MNRKPVLITVLSLLLLLAICIFMIDRPVAIWIENKGTSLERVTSAIISVIEIGFGFTISKYLYGFALLLAGFIMRAADKNWRRANLFFFVAATHIISRLTAGVLKNVFHRSRPFEYLENKEVADFFTEAGSAFPSGHVAHFFGLFLPLVFLFPKYTWLWLLLPFFVLIQRVVANDHYPGDTVASVLIAYLSTWLFYRVFKIEKQNIA